MSGVDLDRVRLPKVGAIVRVRTAYEVYQGEFVGIVPGRTDAPKSRDRSPKLALRTDAMSAQLAQADICEPPKVLKRAPRGKA